MLGLPGKQFTIKIENISVDIMKQTKKKDKRETLMQAVFSKRHLTCVAGGKLVLTVSPALPSYMGDRFPPTVARYEPVCGKCPKCDM